MINIIKKQLQIPEDLFLFMDSPTRLIIYKNKSQIWLYKFSLITLLRVLVKQILYGKGFLIAKKQSSKQQNSISYTVSFNLRFDDLDTNFRIVNYERSFLLFKSKNENVATDREEFWKNISGYHEHLAVGDQKEDVKKRTDWLANTINEFEPVSVLELGCGSGRNLVYIKQKNPECALYGVEINPEAITAAKSQLGSEFKILSNSIYDLDNIESKSIDVVFTSGVLMHIASDKISYIKANLNRIAKKAIIHYELHGPSNEFDFHRYPRDYAEVYSDSPNIDYEVFDRSDFRNAGTKSFYHSMLINELAQTTNT